MLKEQRFKLKPITPIDEEDKGINNKNEYIVTTLFSLFFQSKNGRWPETFNPETVLLFLDSLYSNSCDWDFNFFMVNLPVLQMLENSNDESCNSNHWKSSENFSMIDIRQNNDLMYVHSF